MNFFVPFLCDGVHMLVGCQCILARFPVLLGASCGSSILGLCRVPAALSVGCEDSPAICVHCVRIRAR